MLPFREAVSGSNGKPFSTVSHAIDNKLKKVIENRKHEKITNERG